MKTIGLLVYDCSLVGGAERVAMNMAKELSSFYKVHLISLFSEREKALFESDKYLSCVINPEPLSITKNFFKLSKKIKAYLITKKKPKYILIDKEKREIKVLK